MTRDRLSLISICENVNHVQVTCYNVEGYASYCPTCIVFCVLRFDTYGIVSAALKYITINTTVQLFLV